LAPDSKTLYVPDLGIDKVVTYKVDPAGNLNDNAVADLSVTPGSGPRHIDLHPNGRFAYVIMELTGEVAVCTRAKNGSLTIIQTLPSTRPSFKGFAGSADIHVSPGGKFLYASNRGDANDIAIFSIDQKTGRLSHLGNQSVLGKAPRNFSIDPSGRLLLVANQNSDEVVIFAIDPSTGALTDTGKRISIPNPVCLKWIKR
jgi:6-phosphogluconolactonase